MAPRARRRRRAGFTLLEVMVAVAILAMVSVLIYGAFDGLSRGKKGLGRVNDRYHQGRAAIARISMELSSAFLSSTSRSPSSSIAGSPSSAARSGSPADRVDFTSFSHRRLVRDSHESDQNEISYFGSPDPNVSGKIDLARRESPVIDLEPKRGGEVNVLAEDIDSFDVNTSIPRPGCGPKRGTPRRPPGSSDRLPLQVKITLVLKGGAGGQPVTFTTKVRCRCRRR